MKVIISVERITEYTTIVEMDAGKFATLSGRLGWAEGQNKRDAEREINNLIDVRDWQDDRLHSIEKFEEFKEEQGSE